MDLRELWRSVGESPSHWRLGSVKAEASVQHGRDNPCSAERDEEEALAQKLMKRQHARRCPVCRCLVSRVDGCQFV